jgi:hypothetical protein
MRWRREGLPIVLTSAPDASEKALVAAVQAARARSAVTCPRSGVPGTQSEPAPTLDFSGQLSLKELAALTARARLFVGVDSAPMHIAAAMGTPTVGIFGPSGDQRMGAVGQRRRRAPSRRRLAEPPLPSLRPRRLRRQQGQRLPDHLAGGAGARRLCAGAVGTMKLAIVRQKYTPFGGAERFVERALVGPAAKGVDVTMVARQWQGEAAGGVHAACACDPFLPGPHLARRRLFARRAAPDRRVAASTWCKAMSASPAAISTVPAMACTPPGWSLRDRIISAPERLLTRLQPWHRYTLLAEAAMFRHPELRAVICNSRMVRDDIAARFGVAQDKLHLIHNGVDLESFCPRSARGGHRATNSRAKTGIP